VIGDYMRTKRFLIVYDAWCADDGGDFLPKENENNFEFVKGKTNLQKALRNFRRLDREFPSGWYDIKRIVEFQ
jgi:hypothetical protein